MSQSSVLSMLHARASLRPHDAAFTFTSYEDGWAGDLVLVSPGSIPTTTSGKIRRAACVEHYRQDQFIRLNAYAGR